MAWYAELKRRRWYCINGHNMVQWYRKLLYDEWYSSLTDEQKQRLEDYRRCKAEKSQRELEQALLRLAAIAQYSRSYYQSRLECETIRDILRR